MMTLSKREGIRGKIKSSAEDFLVEEVTKTGFVLEANRRYSPEDIGMAGGGEGSRFCTFIMQKKNWNTVQALMAIARKFRRSMRATGFAGTKDRTAISTQLCSIYDVLPDAVIAAHEKDIQINGAWRSTEGVKMGQLSGKAQRY